MKKPALKIVLALALCLSLLFSFAGVAQAKTADFQMVAYSVYSSCGDYTNHSTFVVYADKVWEPVGGAGMSTVQFSVWTKPDKSDMRTFNGTKSGTNWRVLVSISQYSNTYGKYHVYAYGIDSLGRKALVGGVTVNVAPTTITSTVSKFYASAPKNGTFYVYVTGPNNNMNDVAQVNLRVWAHGAASTEKWYNMQNIGKNTWRVQVNIASFKNYHGWYTLKAYTANSANAQSYISTIYEEVP
jgi:GBS Bsp-like repeat.